MCLQNLLDIFMLGFVDTVIICSRLFFSGWCPANSVRELEFYDDWVFRSNACWLILRDLDRRTLEEVVVGRSVLEWIGRVFTCPVRMLWIGSQESLVLRSITCCKATERHLPYKITQCYLLSDTGELAQF